jgi:hypothetical protein
MSRSNPTEKLTNPAKRFYEYSGDKGQFFYFDKEKGEKGEKVFMKMPFNFLVLDTLSTCKGFDDNLQMGYYSNEVRSTKTDTITVRNKKGIVFSGLYEAAKEKLGTKGLKYYQSVYIGQKEADGLGLYNIQLGGSGLSAFIEFCKENNVNNIAVSVKEVVEKKKGKTVYFEPIYTAVKVSDKANAEAVELDKELQEYLSAYLAKNASAAPAEVIEENQDNGLNTKKSAPKSEVKIEAEKDIVFNPADEDDDEAF